MVILFQFMTDTANVNHDHLLLDVANSLAHVYSSQLKWDESENLLHSSLETYGQKLGKRHAHTLRAMEHLAWTYMRKYRLKEAEIMELEVIEGYKEIIGLSHPNSIGAMCGLAWIYEQQQKYSEAEELCLQALQIYEEKLGANDPQTLTSMAALALIYMRWGKKLDRANDLRLAAVNGTNRVMGEMHPKTLWYTKELDRLHNLYAARAKRCFFSPYPLKISRLT